jgi:hypothetical protein
MIINGEEVRIWRKLVVVNFKIKSQHLPGETETNHKNLDEGNQ